MDAPMAGLVLLRDALTSLFVLADTSLVFLSSRSKPLRLLRSLLLSSFLLLLRLLPSSLDFSSHSTAKRPPTSPSPPHHLATSPHPPPPPPVSASSGDSGISRTLSQLLSIVNNLPVSSRKYEAVRSLAEHVIDDNRRGGSKALIEVNRVVLSSAFSRTLSQLEAAMLEMERDGRGAKLAGGHEFGDFFPSDDMTGGGKGYGAGKVLRAAGDVARWGVRQLRGGKCEGGGGGIIARLEGSGSCAEKLAAEIIWLANKLAESGCAEEAVSRWASATNVAWLAISAQPRLQGSIVKVSAFLFKQAKEIGADDSKKEQLRFTRMKMLMSWLPLLCRASNGTDAPVLSLDERAELEKVLDQTIGMLEEEEEQEQVLSQWLHHFMYCPSSDWPDLHASYTRWCAASRRFLTASVQ